MDSSICDLTARASTFKLSSLNQKKDNVTVTVLRDGARRDVVVQTVDALAGRPRGQNYAMLWGGASL
jgi:hypothetical protein